MAHCDEYVELISAAIDGALSPAEQERLEAHLAVCPECKALYEDLTAVHTALEDLPPIEVPADLSDRIMAAVAAEQVIPLEKKKAPVHWQRWLASAAVLAVVLMGAWSWRPWEHGLKLESAASAAPAAPAAQQNMTTDSSEALPQASEAVEAATESVLLYTAGSEAPAPVFPASGKAFAAKVSGDSQDTALSTSDEDIPAETPEESGKIIPQMSRMVPEPESVVNGRDGGVEPALPTEAPEGTDTEEAALDAQSFVMTANSFPIEEAGTVGMTAKEALDRLLEEYPMPGCETWEYGEIEPGWRSPEWITTDGSTAWLAYYGSSEDGGQIVCYSFDTWGYLDGELICAATLIVPTDGSEILIAGP